MKAKEKTKHIRIRESSYNNLVLNSGNVPLVTFASNIIDEKCKKKKLK